VVLLIASFLGGLKLQLVCVGIFYRKSVCVIDGKKNNDDGKQEHHNLRRRREKHAEIRSLGERVKMTIGSQHRGPTVI
jgi:hypothetical protein